jgi:hypothetical protein
VIAAAPAPAPVAPGHAAAAVVVAAPAPAVVVVALVVIAAATHTPTLTHPTRHPHACVQSHGTPLEWSALLAHAPVFSLCALGARATGQAPLRPYCHTAFSHTRALTHLRTVLCRGACLWVARAREAVGAQAKLAALLKAADRLLPRAFTMSPEVLQLCLASADDSIARTSNAATHRSASALRSHLTFVGRARTEAAQSAANSESASDQAERLACWVSIARAARKAKLWDVVYFATHAAVALLHALVPETADAVTVAPPDAAAASPSDASRKSSANAASDRAVHGDGAAASSATGSVGDANDVGADPKRHVLGGDGARWCREVAELLLVKGEAVVQMLKQHGAQLGQEPEPIQPGGTATVGTDVPGAGHSSADTPASDKVVNAAGGGGGGVAASTADAASAPAQSESRADSSRSDSVTIGDLSAEVMESFISGASLGVVANETWLVLNAAVYMWNYTLNLPDDHRARVLCAPSVRLRVLIRAALGSSTTAASSSSSSTAGATRQHSPGSVTGVTRARLVLLDCQLCRAVAEATLLRSSAHAHVGGGDGKGDERDAHSSDDRAALVAVLSDCTAAAVALGSASYSESQRLARVMVAAATRLGDPIDANAYADPNLRAIFLVESFASALATTTTATTDDTAAVAAAGAAAGCGGEGNVDVVTAALLDVGQRGTSAVGARPSTATATPTSTPELSRGMRMQMLCRTALRCVDLGEWGAASQLADRLLQVRPSPSWRLSSVCLLIVCAVDSGAVQTG